MRNPAFVRFMERLGEDTLRSFSTLDYLALERLGKALSAEFAWAGAQPDCSGCRGSPGRGGVCAYILSGSSVCDLGPNAHTPPT